MGNTKELVSGIGFVMVLLLAWQCAVVACICNLSRIVRRICKDTCLLGT